MADRCQLCRRKIADTESAHQWHEADCLLNRALLQDVCRCDGWLRGSCCVVDGECSPLQVACLLGREDVRARAEAWDRNVAAAEKARA